MNFVGTVKVPEDYEVIDKHKLDGLQICAVLRDESGKIVFADSGIISNVKAGDTVPFDFSTISNKIPEYNSVEYYVTPFL